MARLTHTIHEEMKMSASKPPIAVRRPAAVSAKPTPAPAPAEDDDPFGSTTEAPAAPARKVVVAPARRRSTVMPGLPIESKGVSTFAKYGTSGMPEAERIATGARGSEVFGTPPPSKSGPDEVEPPTKQAQVASGPRTQRTPPARGGLRAVVATPEEKVTPAPPDAFGNVEQAIDFIRLTNGANYVNLSDMQKEARDLALRMIIADLVTRRTTVAEVLFEHELGSDVLALGDETQAAVANAVAEVAAGAAHSQDNWAEEAFGAEEEAEALPSRGALHTAPTGTRVSVDELVTLVLQYAGTKRGKWHDDVDRQLGTQVERGFGGLLRMIKSEGQKDAKNSIARSIAEAMVRAWDIPPAPEPEGSGPVEDEGEWDDEEDDGSEAAREENPNTPSGVIRQMAAAGRAGVKSPASTTPDEELRFRFEGEKLGLANRADALICGNCKLSAKYHKGLKGATSSYGCPGFVPANKPAAQEHAALLRDTAKFKEVYASLLAPKRSDTPEPDVAPVGGGGDDVAGDLGRERGVQGQSGAVRPAVSRVGHREESVESGLSGGASPAIAKRPAQSVVGRVNAAGAVGGQGVGQVLHSEGVGQGGGPDEDAFGGASESPEGTGAGASAGGASGGDGIPPQEYRADAEEQRRQWAKDSGGEFTGRLTWGINYPPNGQNLATPVALALDTASTERRSRVAELVEGYVNKHLFGGHGQLRDEVEYGSPGWRSFVAGRRLAQACEEYVANRHADHAKAVENKVQRAAKDYVLAHFVLPEGTPDPYFNEYIEMCLKAQRPIGTSVEELMAGE